MYFWLIKKKKYTLKEMDFSNKIKHHTDNKAKPGRKRWLVKWQG